MESTASSTRAAPTLRVEGKRRRRLPCGQQGILFCARAGWAQGGRCPHSGQGPPRPCALSLHAMPRPHPLQAAACRGAAQRLSTRESGGLDGAGRCCPPPRFRHPCRISPPRPGAGDAAHSAHTHPGAEPCAPPAHLAQSTAHHASCPRQRLRTALALVYAWEGRGPAAARHRCPWVRAVHIVPFRQRSGGWVRAWAACPHVPRQGARCCASGTARGTPPGPRPAPLSQAWLRQAQGTAPQEPRRHTCACAHRELTARRSRARGRRMRGAAIDTRRRKPVQRE